MQQILKARAGQEAVAPLEPPPNFLIRRVVDGIRHDVRQLNVAIFERAVNAAGGRGLLDPGDRGNPWTATGTLLARSFSDHTNHWLQQALRTRGAVPFREPDFRWLYLSVAGELNDGVDDGAGRNGEHAGDDAEVNSQLSTEHRQQEEDAD